MHDSDSEGGSGSEGMGWAVHEDFTEEEEDEWLVDDDKTSTRDENVFCACGCQDGSIASDGLNYTGTLRYVALADCMRDMQCTIRKSVVSIFVFSHLFY